MTREKAIIILGNIPIDGKDKCYSIAEYQEAKTMAIDALKFDIDQYCKEHFCVMVDKDVWEKAEKALKQEPKTGHWKVVSDGYGDSAYICECSECKDTVWVYKDADRKWNYCPNCGARMKDGE